MLQCCSVLKVGLVGRLRQEKQKAGGMRCESTFAIYGHSNRKHATEMNRGFPSMLLPKNT